jgi:myo-inositol-1(or 4)-monophosphatase
MLDFMIDTAYRAGAILLAGRERERTVTAKGYADVVTDIDRASEALIIEAIKATYPEHAILAEESGGTAENAAYAWLIDPLDGTLNYLHGFPYYCVSLALLQHDHLYAGVIYHPVSGELFYAQQGQGAFVNGRRLRVSTTSELEHTLLTTGFPYSRFHQPDHNLREFNRLLLKTQAIRRAGSAALDLAYVAAGRSDGHWELGLNPWDTAAGALMVLEAGGAVSNWQQGAWHPRDDRIVATNGHIHTALIDELAAAQP